MEVFQMSLANKLRKFRRQCERESGMSANDIELPLVDVLEDVCKSLKVTSKQRKKVLGRNNTVRLEHTRNHRIQLVQPKR